MFLSLNISAQKSVLLGAEFQAYPTGIIPGISADIQLAEKSYAHIRLAANIFDHRDLGEQMDEEGSGWGFSLGFRRFWNAEHRGWRLGVKTDVWFNSVDWMDMDSNGDPTSGTTDITVLQPTAELSYVFNKSGLVFAPMIAFGLEWNVRTEGEPTGEGPIILAGFQIAKTF